MNVHRTRGIAQLVVDDPDADAVQPASLDKWLNQPVEFGSFQRCYGRTCAAESARTATIAASNSSATGASRNPTRVRPLAIRFLSSVRSAKCLRACCSRTWPRRAKCGSTPPCANCCRRWSPCRNTARARSRLSIWQPIRRRCREFQRISSPSTRRIPTPTTRSNNCMTFCRADSASGAGHEERLQQSRHGLIGPGTRPARRSVL